jgi:hypothetical protein
VTSYGLDGVESILGRESTESRRALGPTQPLLSCQRGGCHSPQSSAKVKNGGAVPLPVFMTENLIN